MRLALPALCTARLSLGFLVGFGGVELDELAGLGLTALCPLPVAFGVAWLFRFFHGPRVVKPVVLRVVSIERQMDEDAQVHAVPSGDDEPPRAA